MEINVRFAIQNPHSKTSEMLKYCSAFRLNSVDSTLKKNPNFKYNLSCADCIDIYIYIKDGRALEI